MVWGLNSYGWIRLRQNDGLYRMKPSENLDRTHIVKNDPHTILIIILETRM